MIKSYNINFNLNKFFKKIIVEKQYLKIIKKKIYLLSIARQKKCIYLLKNNSSINYTIDIFFSKTNTLLHIIDFSGKLKFSCSAGKILYKKNNKKAHILIIKLIISRIVKNYNFLQKKTVALHLKNVKFLKS